MTNFKAVLLNTKFDREYRNVLRFDTREAQEEYFGLPSLFSNAENINFNAGSLLETTMIYRVRENESLNDILSKNYCIVQDLSENRALPYYYFFVRNAMQDAGGQVKLWLELDIFQTYYIDLNFTPCNIQKAHLNRFIDAGDGKIKFDGGINSKLFEREDVKNVAKRLTKRTQVNLYNSFPVDIANWLNENIICWEYLFFSTNHSYAKVGDDTHEPDPLGHTPYMTNIAFKGDKNGSSPLNFAVMAFPILKLGKSLYFEFMNEVGYVRNKFVFNMEKWLLDFPAFLSANNGFEHIYAIKLSKFPAIISQDNSKFEFSVVGDELTIKESAKYNFTNFMNIDMFDLYNSNVSTISGGEGLINVTLQADKTTSQNYDLPYFEFSKQEIIDAKKNVKFNPKLLGLDFKSLKLLDETGQGFDYDIQKINQSKIQISYSEAMTPDISRGYGRIANFKEGNIFIDKVDDDFLGFVSINDNSLIMVTSAFQTMLANNKNYFLQNNVTRFSNLFGGIAGSAGAISTTFSGNPTALLSSGLSASLNKFITSIINENLTVDNMRNAPDNVQNAKGSALFNSVSTQWGVFLEEYDILPNEKEILNDNMCLYGFTANFVDDLKKYDNIRKFYNYIQAEIEETTGINISNAVHDKFRQAFRNGVRFWNTDNFNFDKENYERWLENG